MSKNPSADLDVYFGVNQDEGNVTPEKSSKALMNINIGAQPKVRKPSEELDAYFSKEEAKNAEDKSNENISTLKEVGRQVGLTGRYIAEGNPYTALPLLVGNIANTGINYATSGINKLTGSNIPQLTMPSREFSNALTDVGIPQPQGATEELVGNISRGVAGAGGGIAAGRQLAASVNPMTSGIGTTLASNPVSQAAAATTGATAATAAQLAGASPTIQTLAGLGGSLFAPTGSAVIENTFNRLVNNPANIERNIAAFGGAGAAPTIGQATQSPLAQNIESFLSKVPGSSHVITEKANQQAAQIGNKMHEIAHSLAPNSTYTKAGAAIKNDIRGKGGFTDQFKNKADDLYNELDQHISGDTKMPINNTQNILSELNPTIVGAEKTSELFKNAKIGQISHKLNEDIKDIYSGYGGQSGALPYQAVQRLRSLVGKQIDSSELVSGASHSQWKALYGALTNDLKGAAEQTSPEAVQTWNRANNFYRAGSERLDLLKNIAKQPTGAKAYKAAIAGGKDDPTVLEAVMSSVSPKTRKAITANALKDLGKATAGNQDDLGDVFSTNSFLTNWNKLDKGSMIDRNIYGKDFSNTMGQIASTANNLKTGSKVFANPSGTGGANALISAGLSAVSKPLTIGAQLVGANQLAKYMTNPERVNALQNYQGFNLPPYAQPATINQLMQKRSQ